nr:hypothetical protein Iba_chr02fCG13390 [Ipomoea batatas]
MFTITRAAKGTLEHISSKSNNMMEANNLCVFYVRESTKEPSAKDKAKQPAEAIVTKCTTFASKGAGGTGLNWFELKPVPSPKPNQSPGFSKLRESSPGLDSRNFEKPVPRNQSVTGFSDASEKPVRDRGWFCEKSVLFF